MDSSVLLHDSRCSLLKPWIEEETKHEVIDISIATSESLKNRHTTIISSFDEVLEFPFEIQQFSTKCSNIISFVMIDVRPPREPIFLFFFEFYQLYLLHCICLLCIMIYLDK